MGWDDVKQDVVSLERGSVELATPPGEETRLRVERGLEAVITWIPPEKARALAALLLKHADRAEGRGT